MWDLIFITIWSSQLLLATRTNSIWAGIKIAPVKDKHCYSMSGSDPALLLTLLANLCLFTEWAQSVVARHHCVMTTLQGGLWLLYLGNKLYYFTIRAWKYAPPPFSILLWGRSGESAYTFSSLRYYLQGQQSTIFWPLCWLCAIGNPWCLFKPNIVSGNKERHHVSLYCKEWKPSDINTSNRCHSWIVTALKY